MARGGLLLEGAIVESDLNARILLEVVVESDQGGRVLRTALGEMARSGFVCRSCCVENDCVVYTVLRSRVASGARGRSGADGRCRMALALWR